MTIALFVSPAEADAWKERFYTALSADAMELSLFTQPVEEVPSLDQYDAIWVVRSGAKGLDAVAYLRQRCRHVPLVWVTADEGLMSMGYGYQVSDCMSPQRAHGERIRKAFEKIRGCQNDFIGYGT